jgi:hypothetical protein
MNANPMLMIISLIGGYAQINIFKNVPVAMDNNPILTQYCSHNGRFVNRFSAPNIIK